MTQICIFNTHLFSLHNTLNYAIHRACLRMVLLTDVYRNLTSLWIKPRECAFKQFKSPVLNVLIFSSHPCIHLPSHVFFVFAYQKPAGIFLPSHACHMTSTLIHYDFITLRIFDKEYESLRSSSRILFCLLTSSHLVQNTILSTLFSHILSPFSSLTGRDQVP